MLKKMLFAFAIAFAFFSPATDTFAQSKAKPGDCFDVTFFENNAPNEAKFDGELTEVKGITGRFTSKRGGYAAPTGDFLERIRAFYGPDVYPDGSD